MHTRDTTHSSSPQGPPGPIGPVGPVEPIAIEPGLPPEAEEITTDLRASAGAGDLAGPVVVAMSGGVDSSVVAHLLRAAGHELVGLFMRNGVHVNEDEVQKKSCCSLGDARDARMVAGKLGIPFQAVDLASEFGQIIRYFLAEYGRGRTPNPCAVCNRDLKFNRLLRFADELGAAGVATGHYARVVRRRDASGAVRVQVWRGVDRSKDQSYQLFCVAERDLARAYLPLGAMQKSEVRAMAGAAGLRTAKKADSQEICFVPSNDYKVLLDEHGVERHAGSFVDTSGHVLGRHAGTENFTVGQRRGHGIGGGTPLYVVDLVPEIGMVVLGTKDECRSSWMTVSKPNWIGVDVPARGSLRATAQVRYHHRPAACTIELQPSENGLLRVVFDEPQLAVASGQGAAFYVQDRLLGGGWIEDAERPEVPEPAAHADRAARANRTARTARAGDGSPREEGAR